MSRGGPPKANAAFNLFSRSGICVFPSVLKCAGIVTSESRGSETRKALSRFLLI